MFDKMPVRLGVWRGTGFNKWSRPANEFKTNGRRLTGVEGGEQTFAQMQAQTAALDNVSIRSWRSLELERERWGRRGCITEAEKHRNSVGSTAGGNAACCRLFQAVMQNRPES